MYGHALIEGRIVHELRTRCRTDSEIDRDFSKIGFVPPFCPSMRFFWMCNGVRYVVGTDNFASLMTWRCHCIEKRQLGVISALLVPAEGLVGHVGPSQFWVVSYLYCLCGLRTACRNIALCYPLAYFNFPLRDSLNLKGWKRARNISSTTNSSCHWSCGPYLSWGRELLPAFRGD